MAVAAKPVHRCRRMSMLRSARAAWSAAGDASPLGRPQLWVKEGTSHEPTCCRGLARTVNKGHRPERDVSGELSYTRVYVKRDDRWQAVLSQYTRPGMP